MSLVALAVVGGLPAGAAAEAHAAPREPNAPARGGAGSDPLFGSMSLGSSREPIAISADSLVFDNRTHVLTYTGTVVVTQGDMKLESQKLTVSLDDEADSRLKEVVASGDVRLAKGPRWATAGRAVFDQTARTVVLSEKPVMHDGPNRVSGEEVIVYLDEERSEVKGGTGRVQAVLVPPQNATPGAGGQVP